MIKMKKNKKFIKNILAISITIILLVFTIMLVKNINRKTDALRFKEEYESLNDISRTIKINKDNPFVYQTPLEIIKRVENGETFIVYFGFADCPWCRSILPALIEVSKDLNINVIYYVNIKGIANKMEINEEGTVEIIKEGKNSYDDLLDAFSSVLSDYMLTDKNGNIVNTGEKRIYAPNIIVVKDGEPQILVTGISSLQKDSYMEITESMWNESYNIFKEALTKINQK